MKITFLAVVAVAFLSLPGSACRSKKQGQVTNQVSVPDYSKWVNQSVKIPAVHNGKDVVLLAIAYVHFDNSLGLEEMVNLVNDDDGKPWLLFYLSLQRGADRRSEKSQANVFEYQGGKFVHVRDFSNSVDIAKETDDFMKTRYGLEFKDK